MREQIDVENQLELNEEETIRMFIYHTWRGYKDGMNLQIPGAEDYKNSGKFGGLSAAQSGQLEKARNYPERKEKWAEIIQSEKAKENRKIQGFKQGKKNVESGHWATLRTREIIMMGAKAAGALAAKTGQINKIKTYESSLKGALNQKKEDKVRGGVTQGTKNVANGHLERVRKTAPHIRWHVKRGLVSPTCKFCSSI